MANKKNKLLTRVEIWDENIGWQDYDCPNNGDTVAAYAEWCVGEHSEYWATVNGPNDRIRLNGWFEINGDEHFSRD